MSELIKHFYKSQVEKDFIPYWSNFLDCQYGGICNCINNYGDQQISEDKFAWSQGRYLWVISEVYSMCTKGQLYYVDPFKMREHMHQTYNFIRDYVIDEDKRCCFLLDKSGDKKLDEALGRYDASIYADCFILLGMANYARVLECGEIVTDIKALYQSIISRIQSGDYLTAPYTAPKGYKVHGIPMIVLNTTHEYIKMLKTFGEDYSEVVDYAKEQINRILSEFYHEGLIRDYISTEEDKDRNLLNRHINPGHILEDMWFVVEFLQEFGDLEKYIDKILELSQNALDIGWDSEYGGILRFVDKDGGVPKGELVGDNYEQLILQTYDMKLWWVHSEPLYLFRLLYELTGNEKMLENYKLVSEYTFRVFPNLDIGEWIQIRKRDGTPQDKVVALPVKDPFHILRNYLKIIQLYS